MYYPIDREITVFELELHSIHRVGHCDLVWEEMDVVLCKEYRSYSPFRFLSAFAASIEQVEQLLLERREKRGRKEGKKRYKHLFCSKSSYCMYWQILNLNTSISTASNSIICKIKTRYLAVVKFWLFNAIMTRSEFFLTGL